MAFVDSITVTEEMAPAKTNPKYDSTDKGESSFKSHLLVSEFPRSLWPANIETTELIDSSSPAIVLVQIYILPALSTRRPGWRVESADRCAPHLRVFLARRTRVARILVSAPRMV